MSFFDDVVDVDDFFSTEQYNIVPEEDVNETDESGQDDPHEIFGNLFEDDPEKKAEVVGRSGKHFPRPRVVPMTMMGHHPQYHAQYGGNPMMMGGNPMMIGGNPMMMGGNATAGYIPVGFHRSIVKGSEITNSRVKNGEKKMKRRKEKKGSGKVSTTKTNPVEVQPRGVYSVQTTTQKPYVPQNSSKRSGEKVKVTGGNSNNGILFGNNLQEMNSVQINPFQQQQQQQQQQLAQVKGRDFGEQLQYGQEGQRRQVLYPQNYYMGGYYMPPHPQGQIQHVQQIDQPQPQQQVQQVQVQQRPQQLQTQQRQIQQVQQVQGQIQQHQIQVDQQQQIQVDQQQVHQQEGHVFQVPKKPTKKVQFQEKPNRVFYSYAPAIPQQFQMYQNPSNGTFHSTYYERRASSPALLYPQQTPQTNSYSEQPNVNNEHFKRKSVFIQHICCICHCENEVSNRTRFCLKNEQEFKKGFFEAGLDKICDQCYFKDRYQYKKKQQKSKKKISKENKIVIQPTIVQPTIDIVKQPEEDRSKGKQ